jgi:hypothetical protein
MGRVDAIPFRVKVNPVQRIGHSLRERLDESLRPGLPLEWQRLLLKLNNQPGTKEWSRSRDSISGC